MKSTSILLALGLTSSLYAMDMDNVARQQAFIDMVVGARYAAERKEINKEKEVTLAQLRANMSTYNEKKKTAQSARELLPLEEERTLLRQKLFELSTRSRRWHMEFTTKLLANPELLSEYASIKSISRAQALALCTDEQTRAGYAYGIVPPVINSALDIVINNNLNPQNLKIREENKATRERLILELNKIQTKLLHAPDQAYTVALRQHASALTKQVESLSQIDKTTWQPELVYKLQNNKDLLKLYATMCGLSATHVILLCQLFVEHNNTADPFAAYNAFGAQTGLQSAARIMEMKPEVD